MIRSSIAWLRSRITLLQVVSLVFVCLILVGGFVLGAMLGNNGWHLFPFGNRPVPGIHPFPPNGPPHKQGTYGAIERIDGDRIQLRDTRSGRTWSVRASPNTVVQAGPRQRIPMEALRPGQRVFVVGIPDTPVSLAQPDDTEWNAQFIGVVLGQPQEYRLPPPIPCRTCVD